MSPKKGNDGLPGFIKRIEKHVNKINMGILVVSAIDAGLYVFLLERKVDPNLLICCGWLAFGMSLPITKLLSAKLSKWF